MSYSLALLVNGQKKIVLKRGEPIVFQVIIDLIDNVDIIADNAYVEHYREFLETQFRERKITKEEYEKEVQKLKIKELKSYDINEKWFHEVHLQVQTDDAWKEIEFDVLENPGPTIPAINTLSLVVDVTPSDDLHKVLGLGEYTFRAVFRNTASNTVKVILEEEEFVYDRFSVTDKVEYINFLIRKEDYEKAEKLLVDLKSENPEDIKVLVKYGELLHYTGRYKDAAKTFRIALQLFTEKHPKREPPDYILYMIDINEELSRTS